MSYINTCVGTVFRFWPWRLVNHPYILSIFYLVSCPDFPLGSCTLIIRSESSDQIFTPLVLHLSDWWLCIDNPCQNSPYKQILYVGQAKARSWTILLDNSHCRDAARYCRDIVTISRWDVFCWHNCLQKMYTHRSQELKLYQRNACRTSRKLLISIFLGEISPNPSSFSI